VNSIVEPESASPNDGAGPDAAPTAPLPHPIMLVQPGGAAARFLHPKTARAVPIRRRRPVGRRRGTTKTTARELVDEFRTLVRRNHGRVPTQAEFLAVVQIHADTLRSTLKPAGLWPWSKFVDRCLAARTIHV
jgi:hypothetical protein